MPLTLEQVKVINKVVTEVEDSEFGAGEVIITIRNGHASTVKPIILTVLPRPALGDIVIDEKNESWLVKHWKEVDKKKQI